MNYATMKRVWIPRTQSNQETWKLIKTNKPLYADFLIEFGQAFYAKQIKKRKETGSDDEIFTPFYYGGWKCLGAIE